MLIPEKGQQTNLERTMVAVNRGIQAFSDQMTDQIVDEMAVVHIIGAFSAGKSRLVRELLRKHKESQSLLPISSQERQTTLPLEITYGEKPLLRRLDKNTDEEETLLRYPIRDEQMSFDPSKYLLRLEVPEPALLLGNINLCSAEEGIKRLVLKDMPGWNSGDSFVADNPLANGLVSANNISLVYVVRANGIDSQDDLSRLQAIFEAVEKMDAFFFNGFHLVVIVTRCDDSNEHNAIKNRVVERLKYLAEQVGIEDDFCLTVLCVEFGKEQDKLNHDEFANDFWQAIFAPIADKRQNSPLLNWANRLQQWQSDWLIQPKLIRSLQLIQEAKQFVANFKKQNDFIVNMNNTRLLGLSESERHLKIHSAWIKQVGHWQSTTEVIQKLQLTDNHPLAIWWESYWLTQLHNITNTVDLLVLKMEKAIQQLPVDVSDLQNYFYAHVEEQYLQAVEALQNNFSCVCESLDSIQHENDQAKIIATLLSLSVIDAKYADYYQLLKTA